MANCPHMVEWLNNGSMDDSQLGHFFGVRKDLGGELNSSVAYRLNKGLMSVSSPTTLLTRSQSLSFWGRLRHCQRGGGLQRHLLDSHQRCQRESLSKLQAASGVSPER